MVIPCFIPFASADGEKTWSLDSRNSRNVAGIIPRMPPPSILRTVTMLPLDGSGAMPGFLETNFVAALNGSMVGYILFIMFMVWAIIGAIAGSFLQSEVRFSLG